MSEEDTQEGTGCPCNGENCSGGLGWNWKTLVKTHTERRNEHATIYSKSNSRDILSDRGKR